MKKTIACLATLAFLTACGNNEPATTSTIEQQPKPTAYKPLTKEFIPNGHWLFNPRHCSKELPSTGVFDIKVNDYKVTYIGIAQNGEWDELEPKPETQKAVEGFLASDAAKCLNMQKENLKYARFTAPGTQFDFVLSKDNKSVLLINKDAVYPAFIFDEKVLTTYKYVELNTEEQVAAPVEVINQNSANTDQTVKYTNN
jgi:hypothetical protein